ncbi:MAG: MMPL family transporter [Nocardioidaceae bacterium]
MSRALAGAVSGHRTKWAILAFWIVVLIVAAPLAGKLTGAEDNQAKSWLPGNAESTKVLDRQAAFQSPNEIPAVVVYERTSGLTAADKAKATADANAFASLTGVDGRIVGPVASADGQALETVIPLNFGSDAWAKAPDAVKSILDQARSDAHGLTAHVAGPAGTAADSSAAFSGIDGKLLFATIGVVVLILLLTYRSPLLWLLPVISAGTALMTAEGVIYLLASHAGLTVNGQSAGILTVLVFGAGTDYALLLVARYREELRRHEDRHEAMGVALHRAGPAIVASGGTVVLGMLCLLAATMNSTQGLGPVCAVGVAVGLLVMLTLLPALLVIFGRWMFWPVRPHVGTPEPTATGLWARVGSFIKPRPRVVWGVTAVVLAALSLGSVKLGATGLTQAESFRNTPDSVVGEGVLQAHHFAGGAGDPVVILSSAGAASQVRAAAAETQGIQKVAAPVVKNGLAYLQATLADAPDSKAAYATIDRIRDVVHAVPGANALVGGGTAINLDVQRASGHDNNVVIPLVLIVVLIVLALLLRSLLAPLVLIATVVLSFGAALGVSALVFKYVFGFGGADTSLPLFVFVFLVALGIDYNIFLMTRVREEALKVGTRRASLIALGATGGVITSAGLVLAGTFSVLATLPLTAFSEIGFAVAFGVLLDTIIVRSVLVTALNLDIGRWMWWPSHLSRVEDVTDSAPEQPELAKVGAPI